jgi:molecular chaperone Hsp33
VTDKIHRFIFDNQDIRGQLVKLSDTSQRMLQSHNYPPIIADLLQQAAAVSILLATTLKFEGKISLQLQTQDKLKMLIVQATHNLGYRGLVRFDETIDYDQMKFADLVKNGQMSITIEPTKGKRYQGMVSLEGNNLAECVENYFNQSEQLATRIWLFNSEQQVCGLMIQALPNMQDQETFDHLVHLASTLGQEESLSIDSEILLQRLFHQEPVRLLSVDDINFTCGCSEKKMLNSLSLLDQNEIDDIIQKHDVISMKCEFCLNHFKFTDLDIKAHQAQSGNNTQH